jgi:hypothetical protein
MAGEPPVPKSGKAEKANSPIHPGERKWWGLMEAIWDSFCDQSLSPLNGYIKGEWAQLKGVLHLFILFVLLSFLLGYLLKGCQVAPGYALLRGQLLEKGNQVQQVEAQKEKLQTSFQLQISDLKAEGNESKREKDSEIARLTTERNFAQQRLDYMQSLPEKVLLLWTNVSKLAANEPTNQQQLFSFFGQQIQALSSTLSNTVSQTPALIITINSVIIDSASAIRIPFTNDFSTLEFGAYNGGPMSADGVAFSVVLPKDTIALPHPAWHQQGYGTINENRFTLSDDRSFSVFAEQPVQSRGHLQFQPFTIGLTNFHELTSVVVLKVSAKNAVVREQVVTIHFVRGVGSPRLGY